MRLQILETGHRPLQKPLLSLIKHLIGDIPGPILVMSYRRELFGKPFAACLQEGMRGMSAWSLGEVELFAAFVSKLNTCQYWLGDHTAVAVLGLDETTVRAVLADWRTAPINEQLRITLGFLEKLTLSPGEVGPQDIESLRAAEVSEAAIEEVIYVCFLFSVMTRLADAFDFTIPSAQSTSRVARFLYHLSYGAASIPGWVPPGL
jgi:uncharacterized peroxidase-related enzyme